MQHLARISHDGVADHPDLAGIRVDLHLRGGHAPRPVVVLAVPLLPQRPVGAIANERHGTSQLSDVREREAVRRALEPRILQPPFAGLASLFASHHLDHRRQQLLAGGLDGGAHLNGRALGARTGKGQVVAGIRLLHEDLGAWQPKCLLNDPR